MNEPSPLTRNSRVRRGVPKVRTVTGISFLLYPEFYPYFLLFSEIAFVKSRALSHPTPP